MSLKTKTVDPSRTIKPNTTMLNSNPTQTVKAARKRDNVRVGHTFNLATFTMVRGNSMASCDLQAKDKDSLDALTGVYQSS